MTMSARDMMTTQKNGCNGLFTCVASCAGDMTCMNACRSAATTQAWTLLQNFLVCTVYDCVGGLTTPDAAAFRCASVQDQDADCLACLNNSGLGGSLAGPCTPQNDPNCGHCSSDFEACLASTP